MVAKAEADYQGAVALQRRRQQPLPDLFVSTANSAPKSTSRPPAGGGRALSKDTYTHGPAQPRDSLTPNLHGASAVAPRARGLCGQVPVPWDGRHCCQARSACNPCELPGEGYASVWVSELAELRGSSWSMQALKITAATRAPVRRAPGRREAPLPIAVQVARRDRGRRAAARSCVALRTPFGRQRRAFLLIQIDSGFPPGRRNTRSHRPLPSTSSASQGVTPPARGKARLVRKTGRAVLEVDQRLVRAADDYIRCQSPFRSSTMIDSKAGRSLSASGEVNVTTSAAALGPTKPSRRNGP